jgi:DNA modification methylase
MERDRILRRIVHAALPLGDGIIVDPFMGSGSTIAACEAIGFTGIGVERVREYYDSAKVAIPKLRGSVEAGKTGPHDVFSPSFRPPPRCRTLAG